MKKLFKKSWFQVLFFGILIAAVLIIADEKFGFWGGGKNESGTYKGPVSVDKDKTYFTQAKIEETSFDFGVVKEGDTLSHIFRMTNTGKEPLIIYKNQGTCDCVSALLSKEMVAPGEELIMNARFNTKGRKGKQSRTIIITCNTEPAELILELKADVK
jgi:hypothetical protein